ncbi:MAG: hypothetical protein N3I35_12530 [Clostridia bacterium]|nr:hypothetical protein [Clostridia bacterium]
MEVFIGTNLGKLKAKLKVTDDVLAETFCVSQSTANKYINNKLPVPFDIVKNILRTNKDLGMQIAGWWKEAFEKEFIKALLA